jgi:uncharacterized protein YndB with AHSA1/START domain
MDMNVAGEHLLAMTRRVPVAPEEAFAAWATPERVRQFWGPAGMAVTDCAIDLRVGGTHRVVLRDWEGVEFDITTAIEAVEAPNRLVIRMIEGGGCDALVGATATIAFLPDEAGTRLEITWRHPTAEMLEAHRAICEKSWGEMLDKFTAHLVQPAGLCPGAAPPSAEHGWLHRLLGTWSYESEVAGPPGGPPMRATGVERVRSLGGYWVVGESEGGCPGMPAGARMVITMGWDAGAGVFRGTWVGSMMPHMFVYEGRLSEDGRSLALDSEGPSFDGTGTSRYRDIVEMRGDDHRVLTCQVQGADGAWTTFMTSHFRRQA